VTFDVNTLDFDKGGGLVPAIVQDDRTEQVLMLGYMNSEAVHKTRDTGLVTFYSRSRRTLWTKGERSGNILALVSMTADCDNDTLLIRAIAKGPTCHLRKISCFGDRGPTGIGFLAYLCDVIKGRVEDNPDTSYTARLLQGPLAQVAQKVGEEGVETALAAVVEQDDMFLSETADLFYHTLVLLAARDKKLSDVIEVLESRHRQ